MRARINCRLWAGATFLALLGGGQSALAADRYDGLESCELSAAGGRVTVAARCGHFEVAENPDQPDGRQIELAYAVLPARARAQADPVFFLAGGPGQSARETAPLMRAALREVNRTRDLIFLDQRGTGGSNLLDCQFEDQDDWLEMDVEALDQRLRECQAEWDADVRFYTTAHGADDIELLRQRYGFEQINLIGGSYGTRMAQVYLKRYPDRVRRVVIDGVAPTRLHLGSEHGLKLDLALERVFAACRAEPSCNEAFPDLAEAYQSLLARYIDNGQDLVITHPRTGTGMDLRFTRDVLAGALRFLAYSPTSQMMIPYLVHEAATTGDPSRMAAQALITYEAMDDMIAIGLNFAVGCSEDWPGWPRDLDQSHTLLGNSMTEFYARVCDWWPAGEVDPDFHQPFDSEAPILILSGELDPVTPPEYGEEALAQFSHSRHLVGTGLGHIVSTDPCFGQIIAQFIAGTELAELDVACIDRLGPSPFFINLLGPTP